jgi:hypothetical protein
MKKIISIINVALLLFLLARPASSAVAAPTATFTLLTPMPTTLRVGESYTVQIRVDSATPFNSAAAMADLQYPGKGVVVRGGDHAPGGTTAIVNVTLIGKSSTADKFPDGKAPGAILVGARYGGGMVASQSFSFNIAVVP